MPIKSITRLPNISKYKSESLSDIAKKFKSLKDTLPPAPKRPTQDPCEATHEAVRHENLDEGSIVALYENSDKLVREKLVLTDAEKVGLSRPGQTAMDYYEAMVGLMVSRHPDVPVPMRPKVVEMLLRDEYIMRSGQDLVGLVMEVAGTVVFGTHPTGEIPEEYQFKVHINKFSDYSEFFSQNPYTDIQIPFPAVSKYLSKTFAIKKN